MADSVSFPLPMTAPAPTDEALRVEAAITTSSDALWDKFNQFYNKNEKAIETCMKTDVRSIALGEKTAEVVLRIDTFAETAKVVLDGLAVLGNIHPIIGAAVVAFHSVISLDLTRRDNDKKVIAIMIEMQNMMCAMFQLRHLKYTHIQESEKATEKSRLNRLIESISEDIFKCGSDVDLYRNQRFAFKLVKAKNFEQRFQTHVENFAKRRAELQTSITIYIAGGVDQANVNISAVATKLSSLEAKMDDFFEAFMRKLDTPQEKEAFRFIERNKDVENCISKDELLDRLLTITGDVLSESEIKVGLKSDERIKKSRKILTDEVHQNFEEALTQNMLRFDKLLAIQNNNHERVIAQLEKQEGYHKVTMSSLDKLLYYMHPDTRLSDPEVRRIWEQMGLKTSVKAKTFVLTFRDHYQREHSVPPTPNPVVSVAPLPFDDLTNIAQPLSLYTDSNRPHPASRTAEDPDAWLLEYIDVAHVRPIVEAIDADGSGFISVKEIDTFARARPKEWSLLEWMVYWAAGWHINISQYRDKIYNLLIQMYELLPLQHPANRVFADFYLDSYSIATIEAILRSTKINTEVQHSQLTALAKSYADVQESPLRANLKEISYVISSSADATLVAGPVRAESWIYPLLYLLLERHLEVLKLGTTQVLNQSELFTHETSLYYVLDVFEQRKDALNAIFSQIYQSVAGRFETFAYGMFYPLYKEDTEITPAKNTLTKMRTKRSARELLLEIQNETEKSAVQHYTSTSALEKGTSLEFEDLNVYGSRSGKIYQDFGPHPLDGYWSVTSFDSDGDFYSNLGLFHFVLSVAPDGSITGSGEAYVGKLCLTGTTSPLCTDASTHHVELKMVADNSPIDYFFHGTHNVERDSVTGSWGKVDRSEEAPPKAPAEEPACATQENGADEVAQNMETTQDVLAPSDTNSELAHKLVRNTVAVEPPNMSGPSEPLTASNNSKGNGSVAAAESNQPRETIDQEEKSINGTFDSPGPAQISRTPGNLVENAKVSGDSNSNDVEIPPKVNSFYMRRTPADVHRFRSDLNLDSEINSSLLAKKRWRFAMDATKFQVQAKNFSREYVRARFAEQKLWTDLTVAFWQNRLRKNRINLMCALTGVYSPSQSRLYEAIANYLYPISAENTLHLIRMRAKRSTRELLLEMQNKPKEPSVLPDTSILALEKGDPPEFETLDVYGSGSVQTDQDSAPHPLQGYWSVTCFDSDGDFFPVLGLFHFVLSVTPDGPITGFGEAYVGKLRLSGTAASSDQGSSTHSLELRMVVDNLIGNVQVYLFHGTHDPERDTVTGSWEAVDPAPESTPTDPAERTADPPQENSSNPAVQATKSGQGSLLQSNALDHQAEASKTLDGEPHADTVSEDDPILTSDEHLTVTQQPDSTTLGDYDSGPAREHDLPQEPTNETKGSDNTTSGHDGNPGTLEPAQDTPTAVAENEVGAGNSNVKEQQTFFMRRTPADIRRFRRDFNLQTETDSSVLAKNRWKFATRATKFQVQAKNFSWEYVHARLAERRLWFNLWVAYWNSRLPRDRLQVMGELTGVFSPSQSRLYQTVAIYLAPRDYRFKIGRHIWCDYCTDEIVCNRYRCITCIKDDMSDQVDRCTETPACIENASSAPLYDFVHTLSHTLLRSTTWLHRIDFSSFLPNCRTRSENVKKIFRTLEENKKIAKKLSKVSKSSKSGHNPRMDKAADVQPLLCVCCKTEVSPPCWICAVCATDTAVCLECELKQAKVLTYDNWVTMHSHDHHLLRISDSVEVQSREVNNVRLQRELINITTDLRSLERKVVTHLRAATKVNSLLKKFTVDGEGLKVSANGTLMVNEESNTMTAAVAQDTVKDEKDSDTSDAFSICSSDTESQVTANTAPPAVPHPPAPVDSDKDIGRQIDTIATDSSDTGAHLILDVESTTQRMPVTVLSVATETSLITPTPTNTRFFEPLASNPAHSKSSPNVNPSEIANGHKLVPEKEPAPTNVSVGLLAPTPKSRRLTHHLASIDTRISSLETQISSLGTHTDNRISAIDNRLSGVETQLGEILSILRQIHP